MAAATAAVTSMPAVLEPELAARMLLMLYVGTVEVVDDKSELAEEDVLIALTYIPGRRHGTHAHPGSGSSTAERESRREID
jgi:hypothetical protein